MRKRSMNASAAAVVHRIGTQVDPGLLDVIIRRVIAGTGVQ